MRSRRIKGSRSFLLPFGFLCLFFISQSFIPRHAFYVSIHDIRFDKDWGKFDIKIKVFTNDLEDALVNAGHPRFLLDTQKEIEGADMAIDRYIQEKVILSIARKALSLQFIKKEFREDACWIYFQAEAECKPRELNLSSKVLLELFDSQTNIIRLKVGDQRFISNLDKQLYQEKFSFK
ncbi:MAG: DUF6702 family protein [Bacteroidia bacterium]|nr:DUF6702 family protein [Bacteroidia bacterium]